MKSLPLTLEPNIKTGLTDSCIVYFSMLLIIANCFNYIRDVVSVSPSVIDRPNFKMTGPFFVFIVMIYSKNINKYDITFFDSISKMIGT